MERRKVQLTGTSTYIVSLPKNWAKKIGLKAGDEVSILDKHDGSLLLSPNTSSNNFFLEESINVDNFKDIDLYERVLIAKYLNGPKIIRINSKDPISPEYRKRTLKRVHRLLGVEIIEEYENKIVLQDLTSFEELSIGKVIRRLFLLTSSMHKTIMTSMIDNKSPLEEVTNQEEVVDRLYFLAIKQLKGGLRNPMVLKQIGIREQEIIDFYAVTRSIERISDHLVMIARNWDTILQEELECPTEQLYELGQETLEIYSTAFKSLFSRDLKEANGQILKKEEIRHMINEKIEPIISSSTTKLAVNLAAIAASLERIVDYSADIAEVVINRGIKTKET
ncbi:phosphate uptake regulator PhoU [Candidatus Borrarchaeum sp.]|uniref:phosphate uptake regulator PhoU n=1 Tax=Candidatus Borrarchaeum sp. TaxID=2846742 RepID=UPI00257AA98E|nr:phosphate uptake regulator PhoU [Candidatus Borrarchaeum sp.]